MEKIDYEKIALGIISNAGEAKSLAFDALDLIQEKKYLEAEKCIDQGMECIVLAEQIHMDVISKEAQGIDVKISFLLMHAEDQLMSSQTLLELVRRFSDLFQKRDEK